MSSNEKPLPQRSREYGVGKVIAGKVYVHRAYAARLGAEVELATSRIPADFQYTIVKLNTRTGTVSFIRCDDFDTADEPAVGDILIVREDGQLHYRSQPVEKQIYYHKWLLVDDNYSGFDVEASKRRSALWLALTDVDKSRIGSRRYWDEHVAPRLS